MKPTQALHEAGQSLWLDNITRALLDAGILARYVAEYSVTGLTCWSLRNRAGLVLEEFGDAGPG